ncbi:hypothetical protein Z946_3139 [Sulfitobacter noctilucicola]|uniref:Uncharacterized protein n=1 Tax=Sulfitobacter noctilucicola TaxID=1342301 RepID=A0A7W6M8U6_9RHOB|nr:hypothetical protein [Sulfitobacter noctilucicola]KIN64250.1 hypothetical protein Z946_3139 [Sulfitobacter noctilucicola]MBB4174581.1 hypothetical protein [Sulfitobacter noctilucicola]
MAKKPAPAELKKQGEELKKKFGEMRKTQHNFAMQIGAEGIVFMADRKKPPEALWRAAKKEGGSSKGAMGTCEMKGNVIILDCVDEDAAPSGLLRKAKVHFADRGMAAKVFFKGAEDDEEGEGAEEGAAAEEGGGGAAGGEAAAGDAPAPEGGGGEEEAAAPAGESDLDVLRREYSEIEPDVEAAVVSTNAGVGKKVGGLKAMFESQLETNPKKARAIIGLLKTTLETAKKSGDIPENTAAAPDPAVAEARRSKIAELERGVDELLAEFA